MAEDVVKAIFWSKTASSSFDNIVEYLQREWSDREVENFIARTEEVLSLIKRYPEMSRPSTKFKHVRILILDKHTKMVYHYKPRKRQIELLLFWNMKRNPAKFKY